MVRRIAIDGVSVLGVFASCTEDLLVIAPSITQEARENLERELTVRSAPLFVGSSSVVGSLVVGNANGFVVSSSASQRELKQLNTYANGLKVRKLPGRINAAGNVILANDNAALIHPNLIMRAERVIEETLRVDVRRGTLASLKTVGMAACATNNGVLAHPKTTEGELSVLDEVFQVPVNIGTINYGFPLVGSSLLANTKGYVVGLETTGIELGRIEEALGFI
ncbi:MAG: translation initiation factor IF-6 [Halobacteriota archaeon]